MILSAPFHLVYVIFTNAVRTSVVISFFFAICHRLGIINRLMHRFIEIELSKIANGSLVTIAKVQTDLLRLSSTITLTDVIIHSPNRTEWQWDSPLIVRFGNIRVSFHLLSTIVIPEWLQYYMGGNLHEFKAPVIDIYQVLVEDTQVFVEKRRNVFNFHLLDESLDIPDAKEVLRSMARFREGGGGTGGSPEVGADRAGLRKSMLSSASVPNLQYRSKGKGGEGNGTGAGVHTPLSGGDCTSNVENHSSTSSSRLLASSSNSTEQALNKESSNAAIAEDADMAESKANEIVTKMLGAVSSLGRAANEGGAKGLHNALRNQKDGFVIHLKQFQSLVGNTNNSTDNMNVFAKEGIKVIKQMGKVVEKNVLDMKEQVDALSKPPLKKEGYVVKNDDLFRFGSIILRDVRIFTKDIILRSGGGSTSSPDDNSDSFNNKVLMRRSSMPCLDTTRLSRETVNGSHKSNAKIKTDNPSQSFVPVSTINATGWSKPILIKELVVSSSELCPPSSAKDKDGLPMIGQSIEDIANVVLNRMLAETAKSNTGRLLNNAFGEVFAWLETSREGSMVL